MRQFFRRCLAASVGLCAAILIGAPARAAVVGMTFDGNLVDVNPVTGATSNSRSTGISNIAGITFGSDGTLYGLTTLGGPAATTNSLYTINPTTGASSLVGATGFSQIAEGDLAFSPGGTLYGIQNVTGSRNLFTLNTSTGAATTVGSMGTGDYSAMAFSPAGTLYVLDTVDVAATVAKLLTINPATGAPLSTINTSDVLGVVAGMYYDAGTNKLILADGGQGGTDELYSLDPSTGTMTAIGSVTAAAPAGLSGLAVQPGATSVPLPPAALAALPLLALLALRRRTTA